MTQKNLVQVVSYISPELKAHLEEARRRTHRRISMSAYIESLLWRSVAGRRKGTVLSTGGES